MSIIHFASVISASSSIISGETVTLSGTTGAPNVAEDSAGFFNGSARWEFRTNGQVWKELLNLPGDSQFQDGVEFTDGQDSPTVDYWIRADYYTGTSPDGGSSLNTWHKVTGSGSTNVGWTWTRTGDGTTAGTILVRISTASGGIPEVASGYYRGEVNINV